MGMNHRKILRHCCEPKKTPNTKRNMKSKTDLGKKCSYVSETLIYLQENGHHFTLRKES